MKYASTTQHTGERLLSTPIIANGTTLVAAKLIKFTIVPYTDLNAKGKTSPFPISSKRIFLNFVFIKTIMIAVAHVDLRTSIISAETLL
jgi:hypothetical protein